LKDPAIINGIFLQKTTRIEVLGLILLTALWIWRLMERAMRQYTQPEGSTLPGWEERYSLCQSLYIQQLVTKCLGITCVLRKGAIDNGQ
jgi:hypothetical protein